MHFYNTVILFSKPGFLKLFGFMKALLRIIEALQDYEAGNKMASLP